MRSVLYLVLPVPLAALVCGVIPVDTSAPSQGATYILQSNAWADATRPEAQGQILMANGFSTSASSSSSTVVTRRTAGSGTPQVDCHTTATATTVVNGQRKTDHSEKTVHDAGNGCNAAAKAQASTNADPQTKAETTIQQNPE